MLRTLIRSRVILLAVALGCRGQSPAEAGGASAQPGHGGSGSSGPGTADWVTVIGGSGQDEANGIAITSDGVIVVGTHDGPIKTPDGVVESSGAEDAFVAKVSNDGHLAWVRSFGSPKPDFAWSVAPTADGAVIGIETDGTLQIGGKATRTAEQERRGDQPPVLFAIDATGKQTWEKSLPGENGAIRALASRGGDVAVAGWSLVRNGKRDFGTGPIDCDTSAMFVGVWSATGDVRWVQCSKARSAAAGQIPAAVAFGSDGRVAFCARVDEGSVAFGGTPVSIDTDKHAVVVATFSPEGKALWTVAPVVDPDAECRGIVVADDGTVIVAANSGVGRPVGEVIALSDGKEKWRVPVAKLLGMDRGTVSTIAADGADVVVAARSKDGAFLARIDPKTGTGQGAPMSLGSIVPAAVAIGREIYVAGESKGDVSVVRKPR